MHRTNNIRVRNAHSSGSVSPIVLLCDAPGCYRTFATTSGKTQHMRRMHPLPCRNRLETPQSTSSGGHPRQQVSPIGSLYIVPDPKSRSSSPITSSRPATPTSFIPEIEMESSPRRRSVEIEDITGQEDEYEDIYMPYDDIYMPESPRSSPGARSEETPVPEHNRHSSSPHQSQRAMSRDHEARNPPSTTRIFHPDLNGKLF